MTIEELYERVYSDQETKDANRFIQVIESDYEILNNFPIGDDIELHDKAMRLISDYAHGLTVKGNYKKAFPVINRALVLFETYPKFEKTDLFELEFYETLVFDRAVINYHLRRNKESKVDLRTLNSRFPDNHKYKSWTSAMSTLELKKLSNILFAVVAVCVLLTTFLTKDEIGLGYDVLLYGSLVPLLFGGAIELTIAIKKKKIKSRI